MIGDLLKSIFGDKTAKDRKEYWPFVEKAKTAWESVQNFSDDQLRDKTRGFQEQIRLSIASLEETLAGLEAKAADLQTSFEEKEKSFLIKDLFRSAGENNVVLPSLQKMELIDEIAISRFEGLENILPNLRILESSTRVSGRENDENLLNSFLYLVRNFPKLEEIQFSGLHSFNSKIPRLLKKEKPSLIIYYPSLCQYEPEPEKEGTRRDRE